MTASLAAELRAQFGRDGRARVHASGPLELRGPLTPAGLYYLRNVTAGVFGGDSYRTAVRCGPEGRARVESSSATKVYAMPSGSATTSVELCAEPGSRIAWGPHATILHTGSALRQETVVTLHEGAAVLMTETLVMGRIAAGQCFDFASYESKLVVEDGAGETTFQEAYRLTPGPDLEAAMGGFGVLTVVYALGALDVRAAEHLEAICAGRPMSGWSSLPGGRGLIVKALTASLSGGTAIAREAMGVLGAC